MAIGPAPFKSAFAFNHGKPRLGNMMLVRETVSRPRMQQYAWVDFWFASASISAKTATLSDTMGGGGSGGMIMSRVFTGQ